MDQSVLLLYEGSNEEIEASEQSRYDTEDAAHSGACLCENW